MEICYSGIMTNAKQEAVKMLPFLLCDINTQSFLLEQSI